MTALSIHPGEWVVVCDGAKALILENVGDAKFPNFKTVEAFGQKDPPTRALGTERPGRTTNTAGHGRSAYEQTDWHNQQEEAFLTQLAQRLDAALTAGKTKSMIIVAPPRALGVLRPAYSHRVKSAVRAEVDKDFIKLPVYEIEKHLRAS